MLLHEDKTIKGHAELYVNIGESSSTEILLKYLNQ